jgi:hypothetical protein
MSEKRAIAGSKHAGLPQTCQAARKPAGLAFEHLSPKRQRSACDRLQKEHNFHNTPISPCLDLLTEPDKNRNTFWLFHIAMENVPFLEDL